MPFTLAKFVRALFKGVGHRYIKRIPYMTPKGRRYRYIYKVEHTHRGKHAFDESHLIEGTKFALHTESGAEFHGHITAVDGDKVTYTIDDGPRKGEVVETTKAELAATLDEVHGVKDKLSAERAKVSALLEEMKAGSATEKQIARVRRRLLALGGVEKEAVTPEPETKTPEPETKTPEPKTETLRDKILGEVTEQYKHLQRTALLASRPEVDALRDYLAGKPLKHLSPQQERVDKIIDRLTAVLGLVMTTVLDHREGGDTDYIGSFYRLPPEKKHELLEGLAEFFGVSYSDPQKTQGRARLKIDETNQRRIAEAALRRVKIDKDTTFADLGEQLTNLALDFEPDAVLRVIHGADVFEENITALKLLRDRGPNSLGSYDTATLKLLGSTLSQVQGDHASAVDADFSGALREFYTAREELERAKRRLNERDGFERDKRNREEYERLTEEVPRLREIADQKRESARARHTFADPVLGDRDLADLIFDEIRRRENEEKEKARREKERRERILEAQRVEQRRELERKREQEAIAARNEARERGRKKRNDPRLENESLPMDVRGSINAEALLREKDYLSYAAANRDSAIYDIESELAQSIDDNERAISRAARLFAEDTRTKIKLKPADGNKTGGTLATFRELAPPNAPFAIGYDPKRQAIVVAVLEGPAKGQGAKVLDVSGLTAGERSIRALDILDALRAGNAQELLEGLVAGDLHNKEDPDSKAFYAMGDDLLDRVRFREDFNRGYEHALTADVGKKIHELKDTIRLEGLAARPHVQSDSVDSVSAAPRISGFEDLSAKDLKALTGAISAEMSEHPRWGATMSGVMRDGDILGTTDGKNIVFMKTRGSQEDRTSTDPKTGQQLEGTPPPFVQAIPESNPVMTLDRSAIKAITSALVGVKGKGAGEGFYVDLDLNESRDAYDISVGSKGGKKYKVASIPASDSGAPKFRVNPQYLKAALARAGDKASVTIKSGTAPLLIEGESGLNTVIMGITRGD